MLWFFYPMITYTTAVTPTQRALGNAWGHLWLSRLRAAPGIERVAVRDAAQHPTVSRTAPHRVTRHQCQQCPGGDPVLQVTVPSGCWYHLVLDPQIALTSFLIPPGWILKGSVRLGLALVTQ